MDIIKVEYIGSFPREELCPKDGRLEYAFIGRSNVGKSSLINMLCNRKEVARVSNTPGKTQMINYYLVDEAWYLVDLPGYGYAKASKSTREKWQKMIDYYLRNREALLCAFVLIDSTIPPQAIDIDFINWMGENGIPFVLVYTKSDRAKKSELSGNLKAIEAALLEHWNELPQTFLTSSEKFVGRAEILSFIGGINQQAT